MSGPLMGPELSNWTDCTLGHAVGRMLPGVKHVPKRWEPFCCCKTKFTTDLADSKLTRVCSHSFEGAWKIPTSGKLNKDFKDWGWSLMFMKSLAPWTLCSNGKPSETSPSFTAVGGWLFSEWMMLRKLALHQAASPVSSFVSGPVGSYCETFCLRSSLWPCVITRRALQVCPGGLLP